MSDDQPQVGAAIDVGSNSVHLLVVAIEGRQRRVIRDESELLGLGAVVDMEGRIPDDTRQAAIEALVRGYVGGAHGRQAPTWIGLLATEPLRRASNRSHFCDLVRQATGLRAPRAQPRGGGRPDRPGRARRRAARLSPRSCWTSAAARRSSCSWSPVPTPSSACMPVGSARLTAAFVEDDPPTAEEIQALRTEAHHLLSGMPVGHPTRGIVVGGSGTNSCA